MSQSTGGGRSTRIVALLGFALLAGALSPWGALAQFPPLAWA